MPAPAAPAARRAPAAMGCAHGPGLAGRESVPAPGATVWVQVLDIPLTRAALGGHRRALHAAVQASVPRAEVEAARLVLGQCTRPDPARPGGLLHDTVTTLLPPGGAAPGLDLRGNAVLLPRAGACEGSRDSASTGR